MKRTGSIAGGQPGDEVRGADVGGIFPTVSHS